MKGLTAIVFTWKWKENVAKNDRNLIQAQFKKSNGPRNLLLFETNIEHLKLSN